MSNLDIKKFAESLTRDRRTLEMFRYLVTNSYIRMIQYQNTASVDADRFENEIAAYAEHFCPVTTEDLDRFFETRKWPKKKPGLVIALFDGLRNQYDVMYPLLEKCGFCGWFFIPAFFMDISAGKQLSYAQAHELADICADEYTDGRYALSWSEIQELSKHHEICCHTGSHAELQLNASPEMLQHEIVDAKRLIEQHIDKQVNVFSWKYGGEYNTSIRTHRYLEEAGYKFIVSSLKIEKIG